MLCSLVKRQSYVDLNCFLLLSATVKIGRDRQKLLQWKEAQAGRWKEGLSLLRTGHGMMTDPNPITLSSMVRICTKANALIDGMLVHSQVIMSGHDSDLRLACRLVQMYGNFRHRQDARNVFDSMSHQDVISWTSIISAYGDHLHGHEAFALFQQMMVSGVKPNRITYLCILPVCARQDTLSMGKAIHTTIANRDIESDIVVGTELINMYGKFGSSKDARKMFDKMPERNVVTWNAMISTYAQHGNGKEALHLFRQMLREGIEPSKVTFVSTLHACAHQLALAQGKWIHGYIKTLNLEVDIAVGTALVHMYGKCEDLEEAYRAFYDIPNRDVVTWTSMITTHTEKGKGNEAICLFEMMVQEGIVPNEVTFVSGLDACASQPDLVQGKKMHIYLRDFRLDSQVIAANALINMYGKCGDLENAQKVFERMFEKNNISWSALIGAYAHHGKAKMVLHLFQRMRTEGIPPDEVTFSSVLSACSFAGLVEDGHSYFTSMSRDYGIEPTAQHYNRMLDILGRAGMLEECIKLINSMPMCATTATWMTLLGACKMHCDEERGKFAASQVFKLEPECATAYVLLSNIYASNGNWKESEKMRKIMKDKGIEVHHHEDGFIKDIEKTYVYGTDAVSLC